jgi:Asp-tRNA(Asn)/Glu-tRNA(Gln) amidotransferase A subunit family amidase
LDTIHQVRIKIYVHIHLTSTDYSTDHYIKASPSCQRAVLETVDALRRAGHECVEFDLPAGHFFTPHISKINTYPCDIVEVALKVFVGLTSADGYKTMLSHLGPDAKV